MDIKISCIIPYYNGKKEYLRQCVDSILQQDFEDYEILIVDDGSNEEHAVYLEEIRCLDRRIRIISQPNRGVSAARNRGMSEAQGEYVAFVDADDLLVPYFFSEAYRVASENDAKYVVGGERYTSDRELKISRNSSPEVLEKDSDQYRPSVIMVLDRLPDGGFFGRGPVARLIQREIALQVPFPEGMKLGEDVIWNLDVIKLCNKIYMVQQVWYLYWKNPASTSNQYNEDVIAISERHLEALSQRMNLDDEKDSEIYFLHMYDFLRRHIFGCYLGRDECPLPIRKRARMFRKLLKSYPWDLYEGHINLQKLESRTRGKYLLVRSGILYWFLYLRSFVRKRRRDKD